MKFEKFIATAALSVLMALAAWTLNSVVNNGKDISALKSDVAAIKAVLQNQNQNHQYASNHE